MPQDCADRAARSPVADLPQEQVSLTVLVRDIPMPHYAGADLLAESWKELGITVTQDRRNIWDWQKVVDARGFDRRDEVGICVRDGR